MSEQTCIDYHIEDRPCPICHGTGYVTQPPSLYGYLEQSTICHGCDGRGFREVKVYPNEENQNHERTT